MAPQRLLLNADLGESDDPAQIATDAALLELIDLAHIACTDHAGSPHSITRTIQTALASSRARPILLGAHPSYPDRPNFGRLSMPITDAALLESLIEQFTLIRDIAQNCGCPLLSIKPHGALYHDILKSPARAQTLLDAAITVFGPPPHTPALVVLSSATLPVPTTLPLLFEAFADRRYQPDGSLTPRTQPDALITDPNTAAAQALAIAQHNPLPNIFPPLSIQAQTLCIHSDTPNALKLAQAVSQALST